ncbi:unnamed protein product [Rotaria sp. Silwood2]|nr:unnamed protein product [Rotaria sp. Silwood2]CAF3303515.1 unnamed protein product [Rotaria sp. Silwood2]CAF4052667.1 unnamed protein product [Rotaria sp. Silwood2]CAF4092586.1 unnamed protein product [Rotaria sp. Silwood2]
MSSSHNRSSNTRQSRPTQTVTPLRIQRSASVPNRQFIIILTNNPELLRQTRRFQPEIQRDPQRQRGASTNNNNNNNNNRELLLENLLRVELREAATGYLIRTRRSFPLNYVFDMSDIDTSEEQH